MSDDNNSPRQPKKRCSYFSDGREVLHPETVLRQRIELNAALNAEILSLIVDTLSVGRHPMQEDMTEAHYLDAEEQVTSNDEMNYHCELSSTEGSNESFADTANIDTPMNCSGENVMPELSDPDKRAKRVKSIQEIPRNLDPFSDSSDDSETDKFENGSISQSSKLVKNLCGPCAASLSLSQQLESTSDTVSEIFNLQELKDYILTDAENIMFQESGIKIWEVILIIFGISTRFHQRKGN
ncbi:uncharacterized protein LOC117171710 [Belonocnema kinseyi]|uniref:uncharacterized protein LOC117171710 n=1 Tax=Belonocnema kinseyi TaxID=2817044 RepID=UPI00143CD11C|nr:uncharacterized protein LOC117171710 [Belonocnema kinseyi]